MNKTFGKAQVLKDINLEVEEGEFVVFVGPSGHGNPTLLRVVTGLEDTMSGEVTIDDQVVNLMPASKRGIAMVFRSYAFCPHLNVCGNMTLALNQEKQPKSLIAERVAKATRMLNLEPYIDRYPSELSGGHRLTGPEPATPVPGALPDHVLRNGDALEPSSMPSGSASKPRIDVVKASSRCPARFRRSATADISRLPGRLP